MVPIVGFEPTDPHGKQVLIVDDDPDIRRLLEIIIKGAGFRIVTASSGEEAIKKLSSNPDILVLDLSMPGCGGIGVINHFKGSAVPVPPIVVVTAHENRHPAVTQAMMDTNVHLCLPKPIDADKLLGALHRCLRTEPLPNTQK